MDYLKLGFVLTLQPLYRIDLNLGELDLTSEDYFLDEVDGKSTVIVILLFNKGILLHVSLNSSITDPVTVCDCSAYSSQLRR